MWELIRANRRKSVFLFFLMGIILIVLGFFLGAIFTESNEGALVGVLIAGLIWFIMTLISYYSGSSILLAVSGAQEVTPDVHKQLFNVVEEMKVAAQLPKMPKIYIINQEAPNAFATGRNPENSAIAVTSGLLARLNRDELQGVVAHEMSHIINRDVQFMTFAGVLLGTIVLISEVVIRGMFYTSGGRRYRSSSSGGGQLQLIALAVGIVIAILAPIMARLLYFAISRKREYLADASAVRLTRYPEGLASALEKIAAVNVPLPVANKVTAPMYISNPFRNKKSFFSGLSSTHPPIEERIRILRSIAGGAGYVNYQEAFRRVTGKSGVIPPSGMGLTDTADIRQPAVTEPPTSAPPLSKADEMKNEKRQLGDLMMSLNGYIIGSCQCGLKIKIPPQYKDKEIKCPKCGTINVFR